MFFKIKRTCSWDRLSLKPQKIEIIEYSGSWIRESLIKSNHLNIMTLLTKIKIKNEDKAAQSASDDDREISTYLESL